jgi:hypothetical protein
MLKKLIFGALVVVGLCTTAGEANAQYRYGGYYYGGYRPYYSARYYYGPGYGYRYYAAPYVYAAPAVVYPAPAVVYPAPVYYGPRVGVTYATPRIGVSVGF